jgi:hypothetical protein
MFFRHLYKLTISSFVIAQRTVKDRIIANLLRIIMNKDFFLIFERKWLKYMLKKGHFGEKLQFLQTLSTKRWVQKLSKCFKMLHAVVFHVYKDILGLGGKF